MIVRRRFVTTLIGMGTLAMTNVGCTYDLFYEIQGTIETLNGHPIVGADFTIKGQVIPKGTHDQPEKFVTKADSITTDRGIFGVLLHFTLPSRYLAFLQLQGHGKITAPIDDLKTCQANVLKKFAATNGLPELTDIEEAMILPPGEEEFIGFSRWIQFPEEPPLLATKFRLMTQNTHSYPNPFS